MSSIYFFGNTGITMEFQLAQVNVAKMRADLDSPLMSGFVQRLEELNTLADNSKGFVWRFKTGDGNATYLRPYDDTRILLNMSVWETVNDLRNYVYASKHLELLRSKQDWFTKLNEAHLALWWIKKGHIPTIDEALAKLDFLRTNGPSPDAFTFTKLYPVPIEVIRKLKTNLEIQ
jgi:hypothetical protein